MQGFGEKGGEISRDGREKRNSRGAGSVAEDAGIVVTRRRGHSAGRAEAGKRDCRRGVWEIRAGEIIGGGRAGCGRFACKGENGEDGIWEGGMEWKGKSGGFAGGWSGRGVFLGGGLPDRFRASLKHKNVGQTKFIKPNSQR